MTVAYSASIHALHSDDIRDKYRNSNNHNMIKNPNREEATSWLFTSVAKDLNSGRPNPGPPDCQSDVLTTWPYCLLSYFHNLTSWHVLVVLGESWWWWSHFKGKCGFPLAEEGKKRTTFFSHRPGSRGFECAGGLQVTWAGVSEFSCFCCLPPLPDLPRPPSMCCLGCRISISALVPVILLCSSIVSRLSFSCFVSCLLVL